MKNETIIQSLNRLNQFIYCLPYDELNDYCKGVRDMINLLNGEENNKDIVDDIASIIYNQIISKR